MATSFRIDDQLEALLQCAMKRTGQKRSQLIRQALNQYCTDIVMATKDTPYERLMAAGFQATQDAAPANLAGDQVARRRRFRERAGRDHR